MRRKVYHSEIPAKYGEEMRSRLLAYVSVVVAIPLAITSMYFAFFLNSWEWGLGYGWNYLFAALIALSTTVFISFPFIIVFTFLAPFPLDVATSVVGPSTTEVIQRLSQRGYRVRRSGDKVIIIFDRWMNMKLAIRRSSTGTQYIGRLSLTSNME
ncbi:MAG TPA: hypothetical protein VLU38_08235, partial [Methanomassiliicoccales archaeon]|nr:hypothetical protein [Methanomassiliicoccales archaeon]